METKEDKHKSKYKNKQERALEILEIKKKLLSLGLNNEIEGVEELFNIMKDYVIDGVPSSGKIKLSGTDRTAEYIFPQRKQNKCMCNLTFTKGV